MLRPVMAREREMARERDLKYLKRYLGYLRPHMGTLVLGFILIPLITVALLLQPMLIKHGIDKLLVNNSQHLFSMRSLRGLHGQKWI